MEKPHFIKCEPLDVEDSMQYKPDVPLSIDKIQEIKDVQNITLTCSDVEDLNTEIVKEECEIQELMKETHDKECDNNEKEKASNEKRDMPILRETDMRDGRVAKYQEGISFDTCCSSVISGIICKFSSEKNCKILPVSNDHVLDCKRISELPTHCHSEIVVIALHEKATLRERGSLYSCDICSKTFTLKKYIKQHMSTHMSNKSYCCTICKANFPRRDQLNYHTFIHKKERPYSCSTCGKGFIKRSDMKRHEMCHTQARPFECNTCGKTFKWKVGLDNHVLNHKAPVLFPCSMCSRSFETREVLKRHELNHLKKRHICSICSKDFLKLSGLLRHQIVHTRNI